MVRDMTEGKPIRLILAFMVPMFLGNLFQQFYNMVDAIIVGKGVGKYALAAVGSTGSLNFLVIGFVQGLCSGLCISISQRFGAGDLVGVRKTLMNAIYISLAVALVLTTVTVCFTREILAIMDTPADIFDQAYDYIVIIFAGIAATMLYNLPAGILRALGDSKTPLLFLMISALLNVALDLLAVLVLHMGVAGAAYATVISQAVSGILCVMFIRKHYPILHVKREEMAFNWPIAKQGLLNGLPMGLQFSFTAVGSVVLQRAVNGLGSEIVAAVTAAGKVQMLATQPMEALGVTMATYCGQNLGAGRMDRVRAGMRQGLGAVAISSIFSFAVVNLFGRQLALLFLDAGEVQILSRVAQFTWINSLFFPLLGLLLALRNALQGMGYSLPAMLAGVFELVARALVAFCLVSQFQFDAVCFANPAAWIGANILLIPLYLTCVKRLQARLSAQGSLENA